MAGASASHIFNQQTSSGIGKIEFLIDRLNDALRETFIVAPSQTASQSKTTGSSSIAGNVQEQHISALVLFWCSAFPIFVVRCPFRNCGGKHVHHVPAETNIDNESPYYGIKIKRPLFVQAPRTCKGFNEAILKGYQLVLPDELHPVTDRTSFWRLHSEKLRQESFDASGCFFVTLEGDLPVRSISGIDMVKQHIPHCLFADSERARSPDGMFSLLQHLDQKIAELTPNSLLKRDTTRTRTVEGLIQKIEKLTGPGMGTVQTKFLFMDLHEWNFLENIHHTLRVFLKDTFSILCTLHPATSAKSRLLDIPPDVQPFVWSSQVPEDQDCMAVGPELPNLSNRQRKYINFAEFMSYYTLGSFGKGDPRPYWQHRVQEHILPILKLYWSLEQPLRHHQIQFITNTVFFEKRRQVRFDQFRNKYVTFKETICFQRSPSNHIEHLFRFQTDHDEPNKTFCLMYTEVRDPPVVLASGWGNFQPRFEFIAPGVTLPSFRDKYLTQLAIALALDIGHNIRRLPNHRAQKDFEDCTQYETLACHTEPKAIAYYLLINYHWLPNSKCKNTADKSWVSTTKLRQKTGEITIASASFIISSPICDDCKQYISAVEAYFQCRLHFWSRNAT